MSAIIYQTFKLAFATLYPAYASYKAVKTKNVRDYVKWMMYWVVYAFFVSIEVLSDMLVAWIPFYYEMKIIFVLWLLSPTTKGSSILYRKLIHPQLAKRETEIDTYIDKASDQGYSTFLSLGSRAVSVATNVVLASAIKGQTKLADHLIRSASDDVRRNSSRQRLDTDRDDISLGSDIDEADNEIIRESYRREISADDTPADRSQPTSKSSTQKRTD